MNGFLLDTNIVLIALAEPDRLTPAVRSAVLRGANVVSAVTFWGVTLKASKCRLDVAELQNLPALHNDPFDRALIAQAAHESLALVTTDGEIPRYASARLRVIR